MANAPKHPCPTPHCGRLTTQRHCAHCARAREQQRGSAAARGYDAEWIVYARAWLARYPWCGQRADGYAHIDHSLCVRQALTTRATQVDHIRALHDGGSKMDPQNHQSLCGRCHRRKTVAMDHGFGRA